MVQQMSLASTAYAKGVNEFLKSGLTPLDSETVQPPRVAESPVQFECKVIEVKALGDQGGAGNLVICEILKIHLSENILNDNGSIDPIKIDQVSRLGGNWYGRAKEGLFEVPKPVTRTGIGVDQIPEAIRTSRVLTGNDLGMLGNVEKLPSVEEIDAFAKANEQLKDVLSHEDNISRHRIAQAFLAEKNVEKAWMVLLAKR